jgi:Protein of unknown function (DUF4240)
MEENRFWAIIETAWQAVGGQAEMRQDLASGKLSAEQAEALVESLEAVTLALQTKLSQLSAANLLAFDRILEQKLYDIDRAEIQEQTDGSDDGFLYARGFIVAAGQGYYDAVNAQPAVALTDLECEDICYLPLQIYEDKFGEMPPSGISRESGSNS